MRRRYVAKAAAPGLPHDCSVRGSTRSWMAVLGPVPSEACVETQPAFLAMSALTLGTSQFGIFMKV